MTAAELTPAQRRRGLIAITASVTAIGVCIGLTMPLIALLLERDGVGTTVIGLNSAVSSLAMLVVAPLLPGLMSRIGTLSSLYAGLAVAAAAILLLPVFHDLTAWFVLRFLLGLGMAVHWVVSETWVNMVASERHRARVIGAYVTLLAVGLACGPVLIGVVGIDGALPFVAGAALVVAAAVPLLFAHGSVPPAPPQPEGLAGAARRAPMIMATALLAGFTHIVVFALLPIYGVRLGMGPSTAALMLSVFIGGTVVLQLPLGWLADRFPRGRVLMATAAAGLAGAVLLPLAFDHAAVLWPLLFVWGGMVVGLYTVGLALVGERFHAGALASASAAFIMIYEAGSLVGPVVAGAAMDAIGVAGLPAVLALGFAALMVLGLRSDGAGGDRPDSSLNP